MSKRSRIARRRQIYHRNMNEMIASALRKRITDAVAGLIFSRLINGAGIDPVPDGRNTNTVQGGSDERRGERR